MRKSKSAKELEEDDSPSTCIPTPYHPPTRSAGKIVKSKPDWY